MKDGKLVSITSINNNGDVIERQYDNKTQTFYEDGEPIVFKFRVDNKMPKKLTKQDETGIIEYYTNKYGALTEEQKESLLIGHQKHLDSINHPLTEEEVKKRGEQYKEMMGKRKNSIDNKHSNKKDKHPRVIKIQIGFGCNFSCAYCKQAIHANKSDISKMEDVEDFITNFDTWCYVKKEDPIQIQLWGGEPLLYWNKCVKLIDYFKSRFEHLSIGFVTNGWLMNKDIADYIMDNDLSVTISHDGPTNLANRSKDPLADDSECYKWIKYIFERGKGVSFNAVISKQNLDPVKTVNHIKGRIGKNVMVNFEGVVAVEDMGQFDDATLFTDEDYRILRENIKAGLISGDLINIAPFSMKMKNLFSSWGGENYIDESGLQKCGMDSPTTIAVDLKGDVLACHSTPDVIGSVYNFDNIDLNASTYKHWSDKEECMDCPLLGMCRGACMLQPSGDPWYYTCNNEFQFNMAIFEAAFEIFFKERILVMRGDIKRAERNQHPPIPIVT